MARRLQQSAPRAPELMCEHSDSPNASSGSDAAAPSTGGSCAPPACRPGCSCCAASRRRAIATCGWPPLLLLSLLLAVLRQVGERVAGARRRPRARIVSWRVWNSGAAGRARRCASAPRLRVATLQTAQAHGARGSGLRCRRRPLSPAPAAARARARAPPGRRKLPPHRLSACARPGARCAPWAWGGSRCGPAAVSSGAGGCTAARVPVDGGASDAAPAAAAAVGSLHPAWLAWMLRAERHSSTSHALRACIDWRPLQLPSHNPLRSDRGAGALVGGC